MFDVFLHGFDVSTPQGPPAERAQDFGNVGRETRGEKIDLAKRLTVATDFY